MRNWILTLRLVLCAQAAVAQTATLSGGVTDAATGQPLAGVTVRLRDGGGIVLFEATSTGSGQYSVTGVTPGTYYLYTHNGLGYADKTRDGMSCIGACDLVAPLVLAAGQSAQQDFALDRGAVISGRVLSAVTRQPSGLNAFVTLYAADRRFVAFAVVNGSSGAFLFDNKSYIGGGFAASTYYLVAEGAFGFTRQAYNGINCPTGTSCLSSATPLRVAPGQTIAGLEFLLQPIGGSISGRVFDVATGAALPAGGVIVRSTVLASGGPVDSTGRFTVSNLQPGTYRVAYVGPGRVSQVFNGIDAPRCNSGVTPACEADMEAGTPVAVGLGESVTGIGFLVKSGGAIAGRTLQAGQPVRGSVTIFDPGGTPSGSAFSDAAGVYTARGLAAGTYYAVATAPSAAPMLHAARPCGNAAVPCTVTAGTPITVAEGSTTGSIDFDFLLLSGGLSGKITPIGLPASASVSVVGDAVSESRSIAADGTYAFTGLRPGSYRVRASAPGFVTEWYDNACDPCGDRGTSVQVPSGASVGNIDFQLEPAAKITGTVTLAAATRTAGTVVVEALRADGSQVATTGSFPGQGVNTGPGPYTLDGLPAGVYFIRAGSAKGFTPLAIDIGAEYASKLYDNVACEGVTCPLTGATPVAVTAGSTVSGIDLTIEPGGFIEGTVFADGAPAGADVRLFTADGRPAGHQRSPDPPITGTYLFSGLSSGTFFVRAQAPGYAPTLYGDLACPECPPQSGTPVTVAAGQRRSRIDISLAPAGAIAGTVRDEASGAPLPGVLVTAYTEAGTAAAARTLSGTAAASTSTTALGQYRLTGLGAGRYFVATSNAVGYADEVFDNVLCGTCDPLRGRAVDVQGGATTSGIDIGLARGVFLTGTVTDPGGSAIGGVPVTFVDGSRKPLALVKSDDLGVFVASVPAGVAYAVAGPMAGAGSRLYRDLPCPGGTCDPATGTAITSSAGQRLSGIDFTMPACGQVLLLPATLATGTVGASYAATFSASGTGPYSYAVQSGSLPPGVSLSAGGAISGTPSASGRYTFTAAVSDAAGCGTSVSYVLDVRSCAVSLTMPADGTHSVFAGNAFVRQDYSAPCTVSPSINATWIHRFPNPLSTVEFTIDPNPGPRRTGTVTLGARTITINQAAAVSTPPFGSFDTPADGTVVAGSVAVTGWTVDDHHVIRVQLYRAAVTGEPAGDKYLGDATLVPGARPDVERLYPEFPEVTRAGWGYLLLTNMLPNQGNGTFTITAIVEDTESNRVNLGSRTIVANNATATQPFGAIDTPQQGETISGASYVNFGWALTPKPRTIPTNGSTITVVIDGTTVGTVTYNNPRTDIASLFPGLNNTSGPVGYRMIDTTALADGIHTIAWVVSDDSGAAEGIGSRYFTVANGSAQWLSGVLTPPSLGASPARAVAREVVARELELIEIDLTGGEPLSCRAVFRGVERVGVEQRPLPIGSSLDRERGVFRWQPGPGFVGAYRLSFDVGQCDGAIARVDVDVRIGMR